VPSGRTNNYPESGRGLGHVTLTIFGSTVGYPSDSLASCFNFDKSIYLQERTLIRIYSTVLTKYASGLLHFVL